VKEAYKLQPVYLSWPWPRPRDEGRRLAPVAPLPLQKFALRSETPRRRVVPPWLAMVHPPNFPKILSGTILLDIGKEVGVIGHSPRLMGPSRKFSNSKSGRVDVLLLSPWPGRSGHAKALWLA